MKKLAIITTYHGKFPNYIELWFQSVRNNPTIDFFLFTDLDVVNPPQNLKVIKKSFSEIVALAQENFEFKICCSRAYKFPDFRPAFGEIFRDYIKDYDFWGYSEHDLIYGDIRKFLTEELFDKYDRLLGNGHLSFYRNISECNSMYKKCQNPSYKTVYTCDRNFYFEEYGGTSKYWDSNLSQKFFQDRNILSDVIPYRSNFYRWEDLGTGVSNVIFSYENGKVFRIFVKNDEIFKEETLYMHFQKRPLEFSIGVKPKYMVVPNKFIDYIEDITIFQLEKLTKPQFIYMQGLKIKKNKLKEKIIWNYRLRIANILKRNS